MRNKVDLVNFANEFFLSLVFIAMLFGTFVIGLGLSPVGIPNYESEVLGEKSPGATIDFIDNQTNQFSLQEILDSDFETKSAQMTLQEMSAGKTKYLIGNVINEGKATIMEIELMIPEDQAIQGIDKLTLIVGSERYIVWDLAQNIVLNSVQADILGNATQEVYLLINTNSGVSEAKLDILVRF